MRRSSKALIEKFGLAERVKELRSEGLGYHRISDELEKSGHKMSWMTIKNWLDQNAVEIAAKYKTGQLSPTEKQELVDVMSQIKQSNSTLLKLMALLEERIDSIQPHTMDKKDFEAIEKMVKVIDAIRRQHEHLDKRVGKIQTGVRQVQNIYMNPVQVSLQVNKYLHRLEDLRYIHILKEPTGAV